MSADFNAANIHKKVLTKKGFLLCSTQNLILASSYETDHLHVECTETYSLIHCIYSGIPLPFFFGPVKTARKKNYACIFHSHLS